MSQQEPDKAYVYQPGAVTDGDEIFAVAGPGSDKYSGLRMTKEEAEALCRTINGQNGLREFFDVKGQP